MSVRNKQKPCSEAIAYCKYALDILKQRIDALNNTLIDVFSNIKKESDDSLFQKCKRFYKDFQESYDLYFFAYLGHWIREIHFNNQQWVRYKSLKEYSVLRNGNDNKDYAWDCSASYLEHL
jgi:hypothetical protein